jgi:cytochrome c5
VAGENKVGLTVAVTLAIALVVIGLAQLVGGSAPEPAGGPALLERIKPVGQLNTGAPITLSAPGTPAAPVATAAAVAPAAPATGAATAAPAKPAAARSGEQVFNTTCMVCHGTGAAGAPKLGDKAAWAPRIKQGNAVLVQHATQGFTGKTGVMPPRGTCGNCSDQELKGAVEYMVSKAK